MGSRGKYRGLLTSCCAAWRLGTPVLKEELIVFREEIFNFQFLLFEPFPVMHVKKKTSAHDKAHVRAFSADTKWVCEITISLCFFSSPFFFVFLYFPFTLSVLS